MKIYTENFIKYAKIIGQVPEKGHQLKESIYFNFDDSYAYLFSSKVLGRISFAWEKESDSEVYENFLVPYDKFILVASNYPYLFIKDRSFSFNEETFELSSFTDQDIDISNFSHLNVENSILVNLNSSFHAHLKASIKYADDAENSSLNGIFLRKNLLIATNKRKYYEGKLESEFQIDIEMPLSMAKIISLLVEDNLLRLNNNDRFIHLNIDSVLDLLISKNNNLIINNVTDEKFIEDYMHENYVTIEKFLLVETLKFLDPFMKDIPNSRLFFEITDSKLNIYIKDYNKIKKQIQIIEMSEGLANNTFWVNGSNLKNALTDFSLKYIKFQIDSESPIINITSFLDSSSVDNKHIILTKLKD